MPKRRSVRQNREILRQYQWPRVRGDYVVGIATIIASLIGGFFLLLSSTTGSPSVSTNTSPEVIENASIKPIVRLVVNSDSDRHLLKGEFDQNKSFSYYKEKDLIIPYAPYITIDVVSEVEDEWIKVSPFIAIDLVSVRPLPEENIILRAAPTLCRDCGATGSYDGFEGVLLADQGERFGAPFIPASPEENIDFFTLSKGEMESFGLSLTPQAGYTYKFRVGIVHIYKGEQGITWSNELLIGRPPGAVDIWEYRLEDGPVVYYETRNYGHTEADINQLGEKFRQYQVVVQRDPSFKFP